MTIAGKGQIISPNGMFYGKPVPATGGYDADAQAFIDVLTSPSTTLQDAINDVFVSLKDEGVYTKFHGLWLMVGGSASDHKYNAVDPRDLNAAYRLTFYGGWTHNSQGALPNGSTGYADTHLVPATVMTNNNTSLGYASTTTGSSGGADIAAGGFSGSHDAMRIDIYCNYLSNYYCRQYISSTGTTTGASSGSGRHITTRTSSSVHKGFINGTQVGSTNTGSSGTFSTLTVSLALAAFHSSNGGFYGRGIRNCQTAFAADGLSDSELAAVDTIIADFNTAIR